MICTMRAQRLFLYALVLFYFVFSAVEEQSGLTVSAARHHRNQNHHHHKHRSSFDVRRSAKLFVFGDSYSDTGNNNKADMSWKQPFGITFPGKPGGRFSDGLVITDFIAKFMGVKSPLPYNLRKFGANKKLKYGMNFAHGGTGVFDTYVQEPNMTTQIGFFRRLVKHNVFTATDLHSSVALVTLAGNDYGNYIVTGGSFTGLIPYATRVVSQLAVNLKRIHDLGVTKILVGTLEPMGCLPDNTVMSSFQTCNASVNSFVEFHNLLFHQALAKLNIQTKSSSFIAIDLYASFMSVFKNKGDLGGSIRFENPLRPCCVGKSSEYRCGSVDDMTGEVEYTVCDSPKSAFFWDKAHPTQEGWRAVYSTRLTLLKRVGVLCIQLYKIRSSNSTTKIKST